MQFVPSIVDRLRAAGCVFAEDEARLLQEAARSEAHLEAMIERRVRGEPLEHIVGWVDFCGLRIEVDPGVFVPRRRTEVLVREAISLGPARIVVDLACGCGAIGAAIAARMPGIELYSADISPEAVECARRNVPRVYLGDLFEPLPEELRGNVELLVANVPYVPSDAIEFMPPEARLHEPLSALDGGSDGLGLLRRVAAEADEWLAPGGHVLMEIAAAQANAALAALAALEPRLVTDDDTTVIIGVRATTGSVG